MAHRFLCSAADCTYFVFWCRRRTKSKRPRAIDMNLLFLSGLHSAFARLLVRETHKNCETVCPPCQVVSIPVVVSGPENWTGGEWLLIWSGRSIESRPGWWQIVCRSKCTVQIDSEAGVQHSGTTSRSSSVPFAGGYFVDNKRRMRVFDCSGQEEGGGGCGPEQPWDFYPDAGWTCKDIKKRGKLQTRRIPKKERMSSIWKQAGNKQRLNHLNQVQIEASHGLFGKPFFFFFFYLYRKQRRSWVRGTQVRLIIWY